MENFRQWWQNLPADLDPVALQIGPVEIRYYGLMFVLSILSVYALLHWRLKRDSLPWSAEQVERYLTWILIGTLLGARLGYVIFYSPAYFAGHPLEIFLPFTFDGGFRFTGISGLSYHGGLLGGIAATILFCRKYKINLWSFGDYVVSCVPMGYTFGRIGNFLNGELYGRVTEVPWGMYFPSAVSSQLRHPSQLYEAFFEGIFLFIICWALRNKRPFDGFLFCLYVAGYGAVRFVIEYFREPDAHIGFVIGRFSMGQVLCLLMILSALLLGIYLKTRQRHLSRT